MSNKRKRRRKNRVIKWFKELSRRKKIALGAMAAILCLLMTLVIFVASKIAKLQVEEIPDDEIIINQKEEIEVDEDFGDGYTNFVLFGGDSRTGEVEKNINTDTIIIVSLNNETKEIKMVSVYRDTLLDVSRGSINKCNSAYALGGAVNAINMLNKNLDLDIKRYVTVDFGIVTDIIDLVGGIEVEVSEAEMRATNEYIWETAMVAGKEATLIERTGYQTLNGVQATTYARVRKGVGDDYGRTERQRLVIKKIAEKVMKSDFATLNNIIDEVLPSISTNMPVSEIMKYARSFTKYQIGESTGFPFDKGSGTIGSRGSCVYPITLTSNVSQLHEFLFGIEDYTPTSQVRNISYAIQNVVATAKQQEEADATENPDETTPETGTEGTIPETGTEGTTPETGTEGTTPETGTEGTTPETGTEGTTPETGTEGTTPETGTEGTTPETGETTNPGAGDSETQPTTDTETTE